MVQIQSGGSLHRMKGETGDFSFQYQHSTYNEDLDEIKVSETAYPSFATLWQMFTRDAQWFYQHPLSTSTLCMYIRNKGILSGNNCSM